MFLHSLYPTSFATVPYANTEYPPIRRHAFHFLTPCFYDICYSFRFTVFWALHQMIHLVPPHLIFITNLSRNWYHHPHFIHEELSLWEVEWFALGHVLVSDRAWIWTQIFWFKVLPTTPYSLPWIQSILNCTPFQIFTWQLKVSF